MPTQTVTRSYVSITLTLTLANTAYRLLTLLQAIDATMDGLCSQLSVQNQSTGTAIVRIGDSTISTTNGGVKLGPGSSSIYGPFPCAAVPFSNLFVMSDTAGTPVGIELLNV